MILKLNESLNIYSRVRAFSRAAAGPPAAPRASTPAASGPPRRSRTRPSTTAAAGPPRRSPVKNIFLFHFLPGLTLTRRPACASPRELPRHLGGRAAAPPEKKRRCVRVRLLLFYEFSISYPFLGRSKEGRIYSVEIKKFNKAIA